MLLEVDTGIRRQRQPIDPSKVLSPTGLIYNSEGMNSLNRPVQPEVVASRSSTVNKIAKPISHPLLPPEIQGVTPISDAAINENDVLCGRGGDINSHVGNEQFRKLVEKKKNIYLTARFKREKRIIAASVVDEIHRMNPPGRFLSKIQLPGKRRGRRNKGPDLGWYIIEDDKAREKASQALRENAPALRKELKQKQQESQRSLDDEDIVDEDSVENNTNMDMDQDDDRNFSRAKSRSRIDSSARSSPSEGSFSGTMHSSSASLSQKVHQGQWDQGSRQRQASTSQALISHKTAHYDEDGSSFMWNSIKNAAAAASSMVSSCVGDFGQTKDEILALPAPVESRIVLGNRDHGHSYEEGTIGHMAAAASAAAASMVSACWGGSGFQEDTDIEPLALPAPTANVVSNGSRSRDGRQNPQPRQLDIRRGSFEKHTNRRRLRVPVESVGHSVSAAQFSPIRLERESSFNENQYKSYLRTSHDQPVNHHYDKNGGHKRDWEPEPCQPMDFEYWMQHADQNGNMAKDQAQTRLFHPGSVNEKEYTRNLNMPSVYHEVPLLTTNNYFPGGNGSSEFDHDISRNHQPYLCEKAATDSWLGPIASKSSDFSDMDMQLQGFLDLSFDSPDPAQEPVQQDWNNHHQQSSETRDFHSF